MEEFAPISLSGQSSGWIGLKGEFEAEGLSFDAAARLATAAHVRKLSLVLKIGGCEALTDLRLALALGASKIVAPMVESAFAVEKFAKMTRLALEESGRLGQVSTAINIETVAGVADSSEISRACQDSGVDAIVVGRGDLTESMKLSRNSVETEQVTTALKVALQSARTHGLSTGFGGTVSLRSVQLAISLRREGLLDYFETRKVLIAADGELIDVEQRVVNALIFENELLEAEFKRSSAVANSARTRYQRLAEAIAEWRS